MSDRVTRLRDFLEKYYAEHGKNLLFHGWHHIVFVTDKATALAQELKADVELVATVALVHDINYLVDTYSRMTEGNGLRRRILRENGYKDEEIDHIILLVEKADLQSRDGDIPLEAQIVSDADTLFKALPVTIPAFSGKYLQQTGIGVSQLASSIVRHQTPLFEKDIYFYTRPYREKYMDWAKHNLKSWQNTLQSLEDADVVKMLEMAGVKI